MKKLLYFVLLLLPALAFSQGNHVTGSLVAQSTDCSVANSCAVLSIGANVGAVGIQLSGTFSGTVQFEGTASGTWVAVQATPSAGGASVTSATTTGIWIVPVSGLRVVRARVSTYSSGSVGVDIQDSGGGLSTSSAASQDYVTVAGDGVTDDSSAVQTAMNARATFGGTVRLPSNLVVAVASTLTLKTGVSLDCSGSTLKWTGSTTGSMFTSQNTLVTARVGIEHCQIVGPTSTGKIFDLHSMQQFYVAGNWFTGGNGTLAFKIRADSSATTNSVDGSKNFEIGAIDNNVFTATTGWGGILDIAGTDATAVFSNFDFRNAFMWNVQGTAIKIANYSDTLRMQDVNCFEQIANGVCYDINAGGSATWPAQTISCKHCTAEGNASLGGRNGIVWEANTFGNDFSDFQWDTRIETEYTDNTGGGGGALFGKFTEMQGQGNKDYIAIWGTFHNKAPSAAIGIGSPTAANQPAIIFFSSGAGPDAIMYSLNGSGSGGYNGTMVLTTGDIRLNPFSTETVSINDAADLSGAWGIIQLKEVRFKGTYIFSGLPGSPTAGDCVWITDANTTTFNANITAGSGSGKGLACYNGSNWTFR